MFQHVTTTTGALGNRRSIQLSYGAKTETSPKTVKKHQAAHTFPTPNGNAKGMFSLPDGPLKLNRLSAAEADRFWSKVERPTPSGCWVWSGYKTSGYGRFWLSGRLVTAHVVAFEMARGAIPVGMQLDHFACRNRACVNPSHLEPVTPRENVSRGLLGAMRPGKSSRFVGVCWSAREKAWVAQARIDGRKVRLGVFGTEDAAAEAYRSAVSK